MVKAQATLPPLIAVVDDDDSMCRSVSRLFRAAGYRCVAYRSAESFLADKDREEADCLVLDIQLDGMSGIDLLRRLPSAGIYTPVVLMTARESRPEDSADSLANGAVTVRKTASGEELLRVVHEAIQRIPSGGWHV